MQCQKGVMRKENGIFNDIDLKKEGPLLAGIPKRNPFTVPEGYFDSLPSSIMEKCRETNAKPVFSSKIFWLFRPQWMIAIFVCVIAVTLITRQSAPVSYETLTQNVSDSAIYQNLESNIDYVDVNTLEDAVQNDNNAVIEVPARTITVSDSTHNQQDIVNYLMNHNVDASDIEDAL